MLSLTILQELAGLAGAAEAVEARYEWVLAAMDRHGPALVLMLWRMLGNQEDVEDVYQSLFLHLAHVNQGRPPRNMKAYLFKTASNIAVSLMRARAAEMKAVESASRTDCRYGQTILPDQELDQAALAECLRLHLARLPQQLRLVLILREFGDLSYGQIARITGISANSARVYRCRAIRLLSIWMARYQ